MTIYAIIGLSAACMVAVACLIVWRHGARRDRDAVDAALRERYARYRADMEALTREYLLKAPSDEEWLARIKSRSRAQELLTLMMNSCTRMRVAEARSARWHSLRPDLLGLWYGLHDRLEMRLWLRTECRPEKRCGWLPGPSHDLQGQLRHAEDSATGRPRLLVSRVSVSVSVLATVAGLIGAAASLFQIGVWWAGVMLALAMLAVVGCIIGPWLRYGPFTQREGVSIKPAPTRDLR
jgi:hypothetical protein